MLARDAINAPDRFGYMPMMCLNAFLIEDGPRRMNMSLADLAGECMEELDRGVGPSPAGERPFDWCRNAQPELRQRLICGINRALELATRA